MPPKTIRLAVISDLHYRHHGSAIECRPAIASQGPHADPMDALLRIIADQKTTCEKIEADYLLCPGDITDRAGIEPFQQAWRQLKDLKCALNAKHMIVSTGNHEVDSRAGEDLDRPGNVEVESDPLRMLQKLDDYPSTALVGSERRWIYWGRGYEFIEEPGVLFLIINSSHYHWTTRAAEYERGRIGDVALEALRKEIGERVNIDRNRAFVVLLHHHPIPHQDLDFDLGKIEMANGSRLVQALTDTDVTWIVIHGHKHHARLITAQGAYARPVVFAAGSFGAQLDGVLATKTRTQFYIMNLEVEDQSVTPRATGSLSAWSWSGTDWGKSTKTVHGLPDGCGFQVPDIDLQVLTQKVISLVSGGGASFISWSEAVRAIPELQRLMPEQIKRLRKVFDASGIKSTWQGDQWLPTEISQ